MNLNRFLIVCVGILVLSCKSKTSDEDITKSLEESNQWVHYKAETSQKDKHIVLVSGDEEYRSEEALPQLAKILSKHHGFDCTVLFAQDPEYPGDINPNYRFNIPGLHLLEKTDLVIWFTRFRELPETQMQHLNNYLMKGKPIFGIRTATHAFNFEDKTHPFMHYGWNYEGEIDNWKLGFGKRILGETWYTHHGNHKEQSTRGIIPNESKNHPILNGIEDGAIWGATDVYGVRKPLGEGAQVLVLGKSIDRSDAFDESDLFYGMRETDTVSAKISGPVDNSYNPNEVMPPLVWVNSYQINNGKKGQSITSTIGAASDLLDEDVRRLFVNSSYYLLQLQVPEFSKVDTVNSYKPSQFGFHDDKHWRELDLKVSDFHEN